jgi:predicted Zn-dependent protease
MIALTMKTTRLLRLALAAGFAGWLGTQPGLAESDSEFFLDDMPLSLSGSYLAGRSADASQDFKAAAAYLMAALDSDPDNPILIERVLVLHIANGDMDAARGLADRLADVDSRNPLARLLLAADAIRAGAFDKAIAELADTAPAPLAVLTSGLMSAWAEYAAGDPDKALARIEVLDGPNWYDIFKNYHTALISDLAGDGATAAEAISAAYDKDELALRVVDAYGRILARNGQRDLSVLALQQFLERLPSHPIIKEVLASIESGESPGPMVWDAATGAAEVLYGLGAAIGTD